MTGRIEIGNGGAPAGKIAVDLYFGTGDGQGIKRPKSRICGDLHADRVYKSTNMMNTSHFNLPMFPSRNFIITRMNIYNMNFVKIELFLKGNSLFPDSPARLTSTGNCFIICQ